MRAGRGFAAALTACGVAGAGAGAAWALQAAVLPRPDPGNVVAARAMAWLTDHRVVESTFVLGTGAPVHSRCVPLRLPAGDGSLVTAVRFEAGGRKQVIAVGARTSAGGKGKRPAGLARVRLALAGCAPVLQSLIGRLVRLHATPAVGRARLAGRELRTLRIWTRVGDLTVLLDGGSERPLAVRLAGRHVSGRSRLRILRSRA